MFDAFAGAYGYQATIKDAEGNDIPNPQTKPQFAKEIVKRFCKEVVQAYEAGKAAEAARKTAAEKASSEINL